MKLFLCCLLVTLALGDRLEKAYVPPSSANTAGGSGSFLSAPTYGGSAFRSSEEEPTNSYIPPASGPVSTNSYESSSGQYAQSRAGYSSEPQFRILKLDSQNAGDGSYNFEYETENQISQHEAGEVRHAGSDEATSVVRGSYSYTSPEGQQITVNYVADENGFRPEGAHIPTPPPVPEEIKKSLAQIAASGSSGYGGYQSGSENSGAYEGVEIRSESARQYLAPTSARQETDASNRQYLAPASSRVEQDKTEAIQRQYLAPAVARTNEAFNRQYLAPAVARTNQAPNRQYLAPAVARTNQAPTNQYLAPAVARSNEAPNKQYLAPAVARTNEAPNRQYLAPAFARTNEAPNRQYLAPTVARTNEATNRQYLAPAVARSNEATNRQYLAPDLARTNEATNRQYLAPAVARTNEAPNRQYLEPAESRTNEAANRQYLAPDVSRTNEAPNRQYLEPVISRAQQENGGYRY